MATAKAKKYLDIFQRKHLYLNLKYTMATGIYLYCCRWFYVQRLVCHSKLASQGVSSQS